MLLHFMKFGTENASEKVRDHILMGVYVCVSALANFLLAKSHAQIEMTD